MALSLLVLASLHPLLPLVWHAAPWSAWPGMKPGSLWLGVPAVTTNSFNGRFLQAVNGSNDLNTQIEHNESHMVHSLNGTNVTTVTTHEDQGYTGYMDPEAQRRAVFFSTIMEMLITVTGFVIFSTIYKPRVTDKRPTNTVPSTAAVFNHGLFGCCEDMDQCMHGWCCPYTRAADTLHAAGVWTFWEAFNTLVLLFISYEFLALMSAGFLGNSMPGMLLGGMLYGGVFGRKRTELRRKSGAEADFLSDFMTWWCCACCAIVQEARQVDESQGVRVNCCCQLTFLQPSVEATVVGPPVMSGKVVEGQYTAAVYQPAGAIPTVIGTPVISAAPAAVVTAPVANTDPTGHSSTKQGA